jgi:hypothetical protein
MFRSLFTTLSDNCEEYITLVPILASLDVVGVRIGVVSDVFLGIGFGDIMLIASALRIEGSGECGISTDKGTSLEVDSDR